MRLVIGLLFLAGCGMPAPAGEGPDVEPLIVGGHEASTEEMRSAVALIDDDGVACTGTLVAPTVVLTAAHCVMHRNPDTGDYDEQFDPSEVSLVAGSLSVDLDATQAVTSIHTTGFTGETNPDEGENPEGLGKADDIAVLISAAAVDGVAPTPILAVEDVATQLTPGAALTIVGYGVTSPQTVDKGRLHAGAIPFVRRNEHELLAEGVGADACPGDSGGPAYLGDHVVGVTSRGSADTTELCGQGGIWTLAPAYTDWIIEATDGAYTSPQPEDIVVESDCAFTPAPTRGPFQFPVLCWVFFVLMILLRRSHQHIVHLHMRRLRQHIHDRIRELV